MFVVNVEGAIRKIDKWLIIERSIKEDHAAGMLSLVGGKVEKEAPTLDILEKTVKREIFEEVGIEVHENVLYVHSTSFISDTGDHVVDVVFLCDYKSGEAFPKSLDEVENVFWLTTKEIVNHPKAPTYLKESIRKAESLILPE